MGQVAQLEAETALVALRGLASLSKELLEECHAEAKRRAPAAGMLCCFAESIPTIQDTWGGCVERIRIPKTYVHIPSRVRLLVVDWFWSVSVSVSDVLFGTV